MYVIIGMIIISIKKRVGKNQLSNGVRKSISTRPKECCKATSKIIVVDILSKPKVT